MHDTYIKIFRNAASYQASGKPLAWILTIVKNLSYNHLRDRKSADPIEDYELLSLEDESGEDNVDDKDDQDIDDDDDDDDDGDDDDYSAGTCPA